VGITNIILYDDKGERPAVGRCGEELLVSVGVSTWD
jgi:hypothetical protein